MSKGLVITPFQSREPRMEVQLSTGGQQFVMLYVVSKRDYECVVAPP